MSGPESQQSIPTHAPGTLLGGKFRVVKLLGAGGMGAVYEIEHEITKHRRALKMLHADVQRFPHVVARFLREASAAGRVGNPHIIETFDAGTFDTGDPYLVMELLQGETISDLISRKRQLGLAEMVNLIGQAADGVEAAHAAGIVHRDLKPENLFVITQAGQPFVKILDFGVSKFDPTTTGSMSLTAEGSAIGTPFYMPPEQVRGGKDIDLRADIYALGVILYECATGRKPFEADTLPHLALLIHEGKFTPLSKSRPDLPPEFSQVVECAMAGDRDARFPSARSLRDALEMLKVDPRSMEMLGATTPALEPPTQSFLPAIPSTRRPVHTADARSAAPTPAVSLPPPASATAVEMSLGITANSPQDAAIPATKSRGSLGIGIGAGVVLLAAAGVAVLVATRSPKPTIEPSSPAANGSSSAAAASNSASDAPVVSPVTSAPPPVVTAAPPAPSTTASVAPPPRGGGRATPPPPAVPVPAQPPATTPNTRADQKGLAKDNPFK